MIESDIDSIGEVVDNETASAIEAFRKGEVVIVPGGGGEYGHVVLPGKGVDVPSMKKPKGRDGQKNIFEY